LEVVVVVVEKNFAKSGLNISAKLQRFGLLMASTTLIVGGSGWHWQLNAAPEIAHRTPRSQVVPSSGCPNLQVKVAPIAETEYDIAVRLHPNEAAVYYDRGGYRALSGNRQGQIEDYDQAIKLDSDYADAYHSRGIARYLAGDKLGGVGDLGKAANLLTNNQDANAQQKGIDTIQQLRRTTKELDMWIEQQQVFICID
jgi:TPR repeat